MILALLALWLTSGGQLATQVSDDVRFADAIAAARRSVVKVYGAGIGRAGGYCCGLVVSPDGSIVTVSEALLESPTLHVVLPDGRRLAAQVERRDEYRQLAMLRVDASDLSPFALEADGEAQPGDWVIAAANPFKVAAGDEPVSVSVGVLSERAALAARRRAQDFSYDGEVLLVDTLVATPGSAGGALLDVHGRLLGIIGKAVISKHTGTWMNYAIPTQVVAEFVRGEPPPNVPSAAADREVAESKATVPLALGIRLFDLGGRTRPAFVERVRPRSAADQAELRAGDLIVAVAGDPINSCDELYQAVQQARGDWLEMTVKRGATLLTIRLSTSGANE